MLNRPCIDVSSNVDRVLSGREAVYGPRPLTDMQRLEDRTIKAFAGAYVLVASPTAVDADVQDGILILIREQTGRARSRSWTYARKRTLAALVRDVEFRLSTDTITTL